MNDAEKLLDRGRERVNAALERVLPEADSKPAALAMAMRYAVLGSGKRLRPTLVYTVGDALGVEPEVLDAPSCAVELIHAYSLVHDDLPAMDDDDLRRGIPTCHRQFGEASAILTGDALHSLAFEVLNDEATAGVIAPDRRTRMTVRLAHAAGPSGMAGGQAIDLELEEAAAAVTREELEGMHRLKTGALIRASIALGALADDAGPDLLARLEQYGKHVGLAFQIVDDILDVTADTETLGKAQGADIERGKPTYPSLLGLQCSRQRAVQQRDDALNALEGLGEEFDPLRALAWFVVGRSW